MYLIEISAFDHLSPFSPISLRSIDSDCDVLCFITANTTTALELLRENKNKFELVGLEMDLHVLMLFAHSDPKYVMKGVKHDACDYLLKPVRIEELKNIRQHMVRNSKF